MDSAVRHSEAGCDFVEDQDCARFVRDVTHLFEKTWQWLRTALGLHDDGGKFAPVGVHDGFQLIHAVVVKRESSA